ncbi:protein containing ATPase, AAA-type, VAT, partial [mine drainage metagenome]
MDGIDLTIASALVADDGKGLARIDSKARKLLNVVSGDVVEIKGRHRSTVAVVWQ